MTTEVAIINRQAIALAADSAVTVNVFGETKIYNSANKLFALSSHHPVGVMIHGGAQLTGVPWETLIKVYRKQLDSKSFAKLSDYCTDFLQFLSDNLHFFRDDDQLESIQFAAYHHFLDIRTQIRNQIEQGLLNQGKLSKSETDAIVDQVIDQFHQKFEALVFLPQFNKTDRKNLIAHHQDLFQEALIEVFDELEISKANTDKLIKIAANALVKNYFAHNFSGVVIAGFGDAEVFPDLYTYDIECVFDGKLKYRKNLDKSYQNQPDSIIIPFAQEEMVFTFVTGIDPGLNSMLMYFLSETLKQYSETVLKMMAAHHLETDSLKPELDKLTQTLVQRFTDQAKEYRDNRYINPILNTVSILPKDELAAMAEALVSLTSLKRRVSADAETVGGPTDVALISKGDGFVWVRRKYYFDSEINPDFFVNRLGSMLASYQGGRHDHER